MIKGILEAAGNQVNADKSRQKGIKTGMASTPFCLQQSSFSAQPSIELPFHRNSQSPAPDNTYNCSRHG
jgi:hypothetical protein